MGEPRSEEAMTVARSRMPSIDEARHALRVHGQSQNFRVVLIKFPDEEAARAFDMRATGGAVEVRYAVEKALYTDTEFEVA